MDGVVCVGGMVRVAAPRPPKDLTAKQVRELRRLCRKTANRAEFECRTIQLRQIASILAMGAGARREFCDSPDCGDAMQRWVDAARAADAEWRDERPLDSAAVDELREWDRSLKAWARGRFAQDESDADASPVPSKRPPVDSWSSPVSARKASPRTARSRDLPPPTPPTPNFSARRAVPEMSICRVGDTINVSIVRSRDTARCNVTTTPLVQENVEDQENVGHQEHVQDQENVEPSCMTVDVSAASDIKSWRSRKSLADLSPVRTGQMLPPVYKDPIPANKRDEAIQAVAKGMLSKKVSLAKKDQCKNDGYTNKDRVSDASDASRDWATLRRTGHKSMFALKPRNWEL